MRILTHNMLKCNVKNCNKDNFPLKIVSDKIETIESEFNKDFVINVLPKLEWDALVQGAKDVCVIISYYIFTFIQKIMNKQVGIQIPDALPEDASENEEFLRNLYSVISDIHILEGKLVCPNCGREFPINQGIPNMVCHFYIKKQNVVHQN